MLQAFSVNETSMSETSQPYLTSRSGLTLVRKVIWLESLVAEDNNLLSQIRESKWLRIVSCNSGLDCRKTVRRPSFVDVLSAAASMLFRRSTCWPEENG